MTHCKTQDVPRFPYCDCFKNLYHIDSIQHAIKKFSILGVGQYGEHSSEVNNRDYDHALLALRQMRQDGINVDALADEQILQLLNVYILNSRPSPEIQTIIDKARKTC